VESAFILSFCLGSALLAIFGKVKEISKNPRFSPDAFYHEPQGAGNPQTWKSGV
jgi:hypothetical protein